jgi:hypothetical protein
MSVISIARQVTIVNIHYCAIMRMNSTGEIILVHTLATINSEWN